MTLQESSVLGDYVQAIQLDRLLVSAAGSVMFIGPFVGLVFVIETIAGANQRRYRTMSFLNDVLYTLFYVGGFYRVFIFALIVNMLEPWLGGLKLHVLLRFPLVVSLPLSILLLDFFMYWWHRWMHANSWLWAFHSVHHTQEHVTSVTGFRRHPVERILRDTFWYVIVFTLILGVPTVTWLPLNAAFVSLHVLQHSGLNWGYGFLNRVFVSPAFHAFHHSTEDRHLNSNYGQLLSVWDYLFGTAVYNEPRPTRFGVDGLDMPESIPAQLITPFRMIMKRNREKA